MNKLYLALALLILTANGAFAAACDPNTDKFGVDGWCVTTNNTLIPKAGYGGLQVPFLFYQPTGSNRSLAATESGMVITDSGGVTSDTLTGTGTKFVLPRAAVGLQYTLTVGSKTTSTLDTIDNSDTFLYSISGTGLGMGESIKSTGQAGDSVTVTCDKAGTWSIRDMHSAWTNNGAN